jgi:outer membrane protein OmpA-like peptidoglycan-associated protein
MLLAAASILGGCTMHHLTVADKAYDRMAYAKATEHYEKALRRTDDREAALRLAHSHQRRNMLEPAAEWYLFADRMQPLDTEDQLRLGKALMGTGRHDEAIARFKRVLKDEPGRRDAEDLLASLEDLEAFYIDTTLFSVNVLPLAGITSAFAAMPYKDGLVFAGEREGKATHHNPWNGNSFLDLYMVRKATTGGWTPAEALPGQVNGRFHEGPLTFSADGRTMWFTRSNYMKFRLQKNEDRISHLKLFSATRDADGNWTGVTPFLYNSEDHSVGHPALSPDGRTLYFVSDKPGGYGGTDIYKSTFDGERWSKPVNLGPTINTPGNEMFPTLHGDSLFFSSTAHRNMGGLDIFVSHWDGEAWSAPENLNAPVNTPHDDFAFVLAADGQSGYLSSNRSGTDRIHAFAVHPPTLVLQGTFTNDSTGAPMADVEVTLRDLGTGRDTTVLTGPDGTYSFSLRPNTSYRVQGAKNGMFTESRDMDTHGQRISRTYVEDFQLKEVIIDKPIVVDNIYYDLDSWEIRPDAAAELDKLARIFIDNPQLSFELSSHTDSRASHHYNLVLSEARAKSAVDYLIRRGVDPGRITARGYGKTRLLNHCRDGVECTEEEHQVNRRTEFKVTKGAVSVP